jgi:hypothetical protein
MIGRVIALHDSYGFICDEAGIHYYFNRDCLAGRTELSMLAYGSEVRFSPRMAKAGWRANFVKLLDLPPFVVEEGALYIERAARQVKEWWKGYPSRLDPHHRVITTTEFATGFFSVREAARDEFDAQVKMSCANFVKDIEIETTVELVQGHATTSYRYKGVLGIYLKLKKVKDDVQADEYRAIFQPILNNHLERFRIFQDALSLGSSRVVDVELRVAQAA